MLKFLPIVDWREMTIPQGNVVANRRHIHPVWQGSWLMSMVVEVAEPGDFLRIAALDSVAWGDQTFIVDGEHTWRIWCEYATVLVARAADANADDPRAVVGALLMFPTNGQLLILHKIMVDARYRGRGLGKALMHAALERAALPVMLTVDPANAPAVELYKKQGFTIRELVKGYYRSGEDRYVMVHTPGV